MEYGGTPGQDFYRKNILIKPQKLDIDEGGIIKLSHNVDNSDADELDIMKLYLLEGAREIKFNLVGKRTDDAAAAVAAERPDWCIQNIVLKIKDPPQSFSINYTIENASDVVLSSS